MTGTPIYPVPIGFNAVLFREGGGLYSHVRDEAPIKLCFPRALVWEFLPYPSPSPNAFLFRYNMKHERACLNPTYIHKRQNKILFSSRSLIVGVLDQQLSRSKTEPRAAQHRKEGVGRTRRDGRGI